MAWSDYAHATTPCPPSLSPLPRATLLLLLLLPYLLVLPILLTAAAAAAALQQPGAR